MKKGNDFIVFLLLFWGGGFLSSVLVDHFDLGIDFVIPLLLVFLIYGPLYGLKYFINIPTDITFILYIISIALIVSLSGFFIGKFIKKI